MSTLWSDDHFIAGDVALDFANTVYRRTPVLGADLFGDPDDLAAWLRHAGLLPEAERDRFDDPGAALREARSMRERFWAVFDARIDGRELPPDAFAGLLDTARHWSRAVVVGPDGSVTPLSADGVLAVVALQGLRLVLSPLSVRACDRCGWFYIDASRGRRRRWCSMKTCGNQAKAERYRSAHR
jgi:predicted RNA-binding Zn ribbon-like protein